MLIAHNNLADAHTLQPEVLEAQISHYGIVPTKPLTQSLGEYYSQSIAILGIIVFSALIVGIITILIRRGFAVPGVVTALLTTVVAAMSLMMTGAQLIFAAFFAGIVGDIILQIALKKNTKKALRVVCFCIPALYYAFVYSLLSLTVEMWWSVHAWGGAIFIAGITGILMSCVAWLPGE